jgi:hypothetical protein
MKDIKELLVNESRKTRLSSKEVSEFIDGMIDLFTNMKKYKDTYEIDRSDVSNGYYLYKVSERQFNELIDSKIQIKIENKY